MQIPLKRDDAERFASIVLNNSNKIFFTSSIEDVTQLFKNYDNYCLPLNDALELYKVVRLLDTEEPAKSSIYPVLFDLRQSIDDCLKIGYIAIYQLGDYPVGYPVMFFVDHVYVSQTLLAEIYAKLCTLSDLDLCQRLADLIVNYALYHKVDMNLFMQFMQQLNNFNVILESNADEAHRIFEYILEFEKVQI